MRNTQKNGPHMTGLSADAAASCGDDTLSHKNKLERRKAKALRKNAEGQIDTQLVMRR